jgi:hypothetical protein
MTTTTKHETLGEIAARQLVLTDALRSLIEEHGAGAAAISCSEVTPWGTYLIDVQVLDDEAAADSVFERMVFLELDGMPFDEALALRYCSLTGMEWDWVHSDVREAAAALAEVTA